MKRPLPHRVGVAPVPLGQGQRSSGWIFLLVLLAIAVLAAWFAGPKLKQYQKREGDLAAATVALVTAGRWLDAKRIDEAEKELEIAGRLVSDDPRLAVLRERIQIARDKEATRLTPLIQQRLAAAEELALDDIPSAVKTLREIIGASSTPPDLAKEAAAREAALVETKCMLLLPAEWPGDAKVWIDGQTQTAENGSVAGIHQGLRSIRFSRPGFHNPPDLSLEFRGTRPLELPGVEWKPLPGKVRLISVPSGASVWRNGENTGHVTPCTLEGIDSGNVEFVLKHSGYMDATVKDELKPESTLELSANLVVQQSLPREGMTAGEREEFNLSPSLRVAFRWCPAGSFRMGRGKDARAVNISRGFWIGETEFTQGMWESLTGQLFNTLPVGNGKGTPENSLGPNLPACGISWEMIRGAKDRNGGIVEVINNHLVQSGSSWKADLPTEAQWEYACHAGADGRTATYVEFNKVAWYLGNSRGVFHPVASKKANPWGIHDMQGNLHEWCADWFQDSLAGLPETDPVGPSSGWKRVLRGGSCRSSTAACLPGSRASAYDVTVHPLVGFRLILRPE